MLSAIVVIEIKHIVLAALYVLGLFVIPFIYGMFDHPKDSVLDDKRLFGFVLLFWPIWTVLAIAAGTAFGVIVVLGKMTSLSSGFGRIVRNWFKKRKMK